LNIKYQVVMTEDDCNNLSTAQNNRILDLIYKMNGQRIVIYCWKKI